MLGLPIPVSLPPGAAGAVSGGLVHSVLGVRAGDSSLVDPALASDPCGCLVSLCQHWVLWHWGGGHQSSERGECRRRMLCTPQTRELTPARAVPSCCRPKSHPLTPADPPAPGAASPAPCCVLHPQPRDAGGQGHADPGVLFCCSSRIGAVPGLQRVLHLLLCKSHLCAALRAWLGGPGAGRGGLCACLCFAPSLCVPPAL